MNEYHRFSRKLTRGDIIDRASLSGNSYYEMIEHLMRTYGQDITSQVIQAYEQAILPMIKEYLTKREELVKAAFQIVSVALKSLGWENW